MATIVRYRDKGWVAENLLLLPAVLAVAAGISFWALVLDRLPPINLTDGKVVPQVVHPGDIIYPTWKMEKLRGGVWSAILSREIVDGRGTVWRDKQQVISDVVYPDEYEISSSVPVPYGAQFGTPGKTSRYRIVGCYRSRGISLTRWFPICISWPELPFEIVPSPAKAEGTMK